MAVLRSKDVQDLCSDRLIIETHKGFEFIFVDYRGLKEQEMMDLASRHGALTLLTKLSFIADLNNTYITPAYMEHVRTQVIATRDIMIKGALLGIDPVKEMILKGLVFFYGANYRSFETWDKAIEFLMIDSPEEA